MLPNEEEFLAIERAAELDGLRLKKFREQLFEPTNPFPEAPQLAEYSWEEFDETGTSFLEERGVEAFVNLLATVGGIVFSAIRTAGIYYIAETKLLETYGMSINAQRIWSFLAAASAIAIIEGVMAGWGWIHGKNSNKTNTSWAPVWLAGTIAALAGVLPTFELLPPFGGKEGLHLFLIGLLTFLSGPGIGYLVVVVTQNYGHLHNAWRASLDQRIAEHNADQLRREAEHNTRNNQLLQTYEDAREEWFTRLGDAFKRARARRPVVHPNGNGATPPPQPEPEEPEQSADEIQIRVERWLNDQIPPISPHDVGIKPGQLVSPKQIAQALGFKDSEPIRVPLSRLRKKYPAPS